MPQQREVYKKGLSGLTVFDTRSYFSYIQPVATDGVRRGFTLRASNKTSLSGHFLETMWSRVAAIRVGPYDPIDQSLVHTLVLSDTFAARRIHHRMRLAERFGDVAGASAIAAQLLAAMEIHWSGP